MPFTFNAVELCVATIDEKLWTRAREVYRALEYGKTTKAADVVRYLCRKTNYAHKWQLTGLVSETKPVDWPKDLEKYDIYTNEEGIYEIYFQVNNQRQKTSGDTAAMCCFLMFGSSLQRK